ncbi:GNAT family N-acetyltransferase [Actinopolymorpha sp. B9G3]|uniref:GNAT family N-acetyltransferase n=1 Tax=Actinopolymorpha sp. B9G3 TaxID=3158970 RepID=UPI0032D96659
MVPAANLSVWPLRGLRLVSRDLELRYPTADDIEVLVRLAGQAEYEPSLPWMAGRDGSGRLDSSEQRARRLLQCLWREQGQWSPGGWTLTLATVVAGGIVGMQRLFATQFPVRREVASGSWLAADHRGKGIGTEMRAAVLHLSFAGIGATYARTEAREDNAASIAVSRKLGYVDDGVSVSVEDRRAVAYRRLRLDRDTWYSQNCTPIEIHGLQPCISMFGAG